MGLRENKERQLGILRGLMICEYLLMRKQPPKTVCDAMKSGMNIINLVKEHRIVSTTPVHQKGLAIVGEKRREVIVKRQING